MYISIVPFHSFTFLFYCILSNNRFVRYWCVCVLPGTMSIYCIFCFNIYSTRSTSSLNVLHMAFLSHYIHKNLATTISKKKKKEKNDERLERAFIHISPPSAQSITFIFNKKSVGIMCIHCLKSYYASFIIIQKKNFSFCCLMQS